MAGRGIVRLVGTLIWVIGVVCYGDSARAEGCEGCLSFRPKASGPSPLLVLLHGDEGSPRKVFATWKPLAERRGVALFAPRCPLERGCHVGSYWRWEGDPAWLFERIAELEREVSIDPARRYLVGWSGGASYMGLFGERWGERFAAIVLAGGGIPPRAAAACDPCAPAVRYMMGDRNPFFHLAEETRSHFERCQHEIVWGRLVGKDHAAEWRAHSAQQNVEDTLDWLLARHRSCKVAHEAPPDPELLVAPSPAEPAASQRPAAIEPPNAPVRASRPQAGCACRGSAAADSGFGLGGLVLTLLGIRRRAGSRGVRAFRSKAAPHARNAPRAAPSARQTPTSRSPRRRLRR